MSHDHFKVVNHVYSLVRSLLAVFVFCFQDFIQEQNDKNQWIFLISLMFSLNSQKLNEEDKSSKVFFPS